MASEEKYVVTVVLPSRQARVLNEIAQRLGTSIDVLVESAIQELLTYTLPLTRTSKNKPRRA